MTKQEHDQALTEQHRNTRNDAVEAIQAITKRWNNQGKTLWDKAFINELIGAIVNLEQRKP